MTIARSLLLFLLAGVAEIGGARLVRQGVPENRGLLFVAAGMLALAGYGFVAAPQPDPHFGRVLAAYGGVFVAGSLDWAVLVDRFRRDSFPATFTKTCGPSTAGCTATWTDTWR
ncbi:YnfA family protein [Plantactinospora sp. KLBMP9567]|uniref:YnfA family protein n=1 Tax=Plantactinospora sp. KLBMP9567 TaxID=3085900 RepID=UPI0029821706|nr:YnfA family protein [Plantactinospora sp. KLBMP9567]MDW5322806.1 YnfA family protein [Plantactinospora sp. KLBMP9567]